MEKDTRYLPLSIIYDSQGDKAAFKENILSKILLNIFD